MKKNKELRTKIYVYGVLVFLTVLSFIPFYIMIVNSTRSNVEITRGLSLLPGKALVKNYNILLDKIDIWRGFKNSLTIAVPFTILSAYFGSLTAYGFAVYNFKYKNFLFGFILATMMIPQQLGLIGYFELNNKLGLLDTYFPLIIPALTNTMTIFFLKQYVEQSLPKSLVEAARIDGAGEFMIFNKISLPIMMPAIATMSIFNFVGAWNNYISPLVLLFTREKYPLPVLISIVRGSAYRTNYGAMYLAIAISVVPILIAFSVLSKYIINGLTIGAVKE
ncbi:carbohydrate ABC transporter membrane protein 2 (CUT1 family) [Hypnocyclicus thermotrophus]|uniref:Carbohydrate ABC transporter membrane protein 2 (CUT1 family) n=1 Tax=Hypnocyclicus thermotrophus TaxID=1627895 RepID=A0AA46I4Z5_9FUSO|nr:carbohydrate ABC transporter permease [Hypnocyclicus thermotrophus]TDT67939.1 carbohydrate ABC transporter membrane protein 2 (CUT1 family) [Hypnocyclicus thermotrophus]